LIFGSSFDDKIFVPALVTVLKDQLSLDMILQILLHRIDLGSFLMVAAMSILLAIFNPVGSYVLDNGDSCSQLPIDVD
jgi:hypothetical protein